MLTYAQRPDDHSAGIRIKMPRFWAVLFFGRLTKDFNEFRLVGMVSPPIFRRFLMDLVDLWMHDGDEPTKQFRRGLFCRFDFSNEQEPDPPVKFWPFYAYLICFDLYDATRLDFYREHCEQLQSELAVNRMYVDYLLHFHVLSTQKRVIGTLQPPSEVLLGLFTGHLSGFLESAAVQRELFKFPVGQATSFFSAHKNRLILSASEAPPAFSCVVLKYISHQLGVELTNLDAVIGKLTDPRDWERFAPLVSVLDMSQMDAEAVVAAGPLALQGLRQSGLLVVLERLAAEDERASHAERDLNRVRDQLQEIEREEQIPKNPSPPPPEWRIIQGDENMDVFQFMRERRRPAIVDGNFGAESQALLPHLIEKDYKWEGRRVYRSANEDSSFVCVDFGSGYRVQVSRYSLTSTGQRSTGPHPKSWILEGANERHSAAWVLLSDCRYQERSKSGTGGAERQTLNGKDLTVTEEIQREKRQKFRFVRLTQVDTNWANQKVLCFANLTLFGEVWASDAQV
jgi:hypothetical protein